MPRTTGSGRCTVSGFVSSLAELPDAARSRDHEWRSPATMVVDGPWTGLRLVDPSGIWHRKDEDLVRHRCRIGIAPQDVTQCRSRDGSRGPCIELLVQPEEPVPAA